MGKLPKSIIRKYGITKKAWSIYKRGKSSKKRASYKRSKTRTKRRRSYSMARRKVRRRSYARKGINWANQMKGALVVVGYESMIEPMIPASGLLKNVAGLAAGAYLFKKKGALGQAGKTLVAINTVQVARQFAAPLIGQVAGSLGGLFGGSNL